MLETGFSGITEECFEPESGLDNNPILRGNCAILSQSLTIFSALSLLPCIRLDHGDLYVSLAQY